MRYYLAPMEGITTYIYRRAYHKYFRPMDKYFTPFLTPHLKKSFTTKELKEIAPEHNEGMHLVPQILTNDAEGFVQTVRKLEELGYREMNLNLGCPSKTVVSKGRGSGFLAKTEELDRFLDEIYSRTDALISIKTRIGKSSPEEFGRLLNIYSQYPVEELIIHPRVQQDFYRNTPNLAAFEEAAKRCKCSLCYNGDIFAVSDYEKLQTRFPGLEVVMLGRGIIANPGLVEELEGQKAVSAGRLREFHDEILHTYLENDAGEKNTLFKMKEIWFYLGRMFPDGEKKLKKVKKAVRIADYERAVDELFALLS